MFVIITESHVLKHHSLLIQDLILQIRLGCLPEERSVPQEVRVSLEFRFPTPPKGIQSDELTDTLCYAEICAGLRNACEGREFKLIEKLAQVFFEATTQLVKKFDPGIQTAITVHKVAPPVPNLRGGTVYRLGDFN